MSTEKPADSRSSSDPNHPREWYDVARERGADAAAMLVERPSSTGPVYMAGYAVECSLKGYLRCLNQPFPSRGPDGHDLRGLWRAVELKLRDIQDPTGSKAFFFEDWSTDLRYAAQIDSSFSAKELVEAAKKLSGIIQTQTKRSKGRRSR